MKQHTQSRRDGVAWSRREFLQATAVGGAALLLPWGVTSRSAYAAGSPSLSLRRITLTSGERADVIVDFSQPGMSNGVVLTNRDMDQMHMDAPLIDEIMAFHVGATAVSDGVILPATLASIAPLDIAGAPQRYFKLEDEYDANIGDAMWHITGPTRSVPSTASTCRPTPCRTAASRCGTG